MCVALGVALAGDARAQSDSDRAAARAAATAGLRAYQEGRYQDAVDLCSRAEALMHAPTHLLLVARAQAKLGHLVEAQEAYFRIKRDQLPAGAPRAFVEAQASAAEEQAALAPRIPTIKIALEGATAKDVTLTIDGQNVSSAIVGLPKPVNPGQHTLTAHAPSAESETVTVTVPEGASQNTTLVLHSVGGATVAADTSQAPAPTAPPPPPEQPEKGGGSGLRVAGWVGVGIGAVGAALGTIFMIQNRSDVNDANALCNATGCPLSKKSQIDNYDSSASQASTLGWVGYGVGVAGVGAGIAMLVMSGSHGAAPPSSGGDPVRTVRAAMVEPTVGPTSVGLRVRF